MASVHSIHPLHRTRGTFDLNPSSSRTSQSDTPYASDLSDLQTSVHPSYSPVESAPKTTRNSSLSFRARAETLSSNYSATSCSSPVRRKPLPATASHLATRFSSGEHLAGKLELPVQPFTRPFAEDSPTLYDFPPTSQERFSLAPCPEESSPKYQYVAPSPRFETKTFQRIALMW